MRQNQQHSTTSFPAAFDSASNPAYHTSTAIAVILLCSFSLTVSPVLTFHHAVQHVDAGLRLQLDMMIQTWATQHIRVSIPLPNAKSFSFVQTHLSPTTGLHIQTCSSSTANVSATRASWCAGRGVKIDVWQSMNQRFQQRLVDPRVDLTTVPWSPWKDTEWILPCMFQFDDRRQELDDISDRYWFEEQADVVFVADFPGMSLEHYINATETKVATLVVMDGDVKIEFLEPDPGGRVDEYGEEVVTTHFHTPRVGENVSLPGNVTHIVHTQGTEPSRYFYSYVREKLISDEEKAERAKEDEERHRSILGEDADLESDWSKIVINWEKRIELHKEKAEGR